MAKPSRTVAAEVERLRADLDEHSHRYYVLDDPIVSDAEYGAWEGTRVARVNPAAANGVNIVLVEHRPGVL